MKKVLLIFIILLFMLNGCKESKISDIVKPDIDLETNTAIPQNSQTDTNSEIPLISTGDLPIEFQRVNTLSILSTGDNSNKYYGIGDWQTYFSKKYGINLYIDYKIPRIDDIFNGSFTSESIICLANPDALPDAYVTDIFRYSDSEISYDLGSYYNKYGWGKYIDKEVFDELNINGSIFAVPSISTKYVVPRYYNLDYLTALDMEVPTTIDEFHEYLISSNQLKKDDDKFYPMVISFISPVKCTADIFRAFGVYFNSVWWNSAVTLNPNTGTYENGVFAPEIESAVEFIRGLQLEDLLVISGTRQFGTEGYSDKSTGYILDKTKFSKQFATEYNDVYSTDRNEFVPYVIAESEYEKINGYYLTHINTENVCEVRRDMSFYIFPKTIKNIDGIIELFNEVFTNNRMYADMKYGIEGEDYYMIDGMAVGERPKTGYFVNLNQIVPSLINEESLAADKEAAIDRIADKLIFEQNAFNSFYTYHNLHNDGYRINMDRALELLFYPELSPYDAIEQYKTEFRKSGILEILNDVNERLGTVPTYDYEP